MKKKLNLILLSILLLSLVIIIISTSLHFLSGGDIPYDYGITIDAGSSKTKFVLYDWKSVKRNGTGFVEEIYSQKLKISIDEYANKSDELVKPLVTTIHQVSNRIDRTREQFSIPIYLGATAGMRLLRAINKEDSDKILKEIRSSFEQYTDSQKRFKENVEIISGEKEGLYCWISTNYLMGYVPPEDRPVDGTVGIMDMGGASAQIAFQTVCGAKDSCKLETEKPIIEGNEKTSLFGIEYDIHTYSNLCFGNDGARRRYWYVLIISSTSSDTNQIDDPCTHPEQLERTITKKQLLEDVCTDTDKVKKALAKESYILKATPDINRCRELTKKLVTPDFVKEHFTSNEEEISFKVNIR